MNLQNDDPTALEAAEALEIAAEMERAGNRRAAPQRWFGAGVAGLVFCQFGLYALQDPYPYIVFPILGIGLLMAGFRETAGAYGRDFTGTSANILGLIVFTAVMVSIFFGSIYLRRAYDLFWVPVVVGLLAGLIIFWLSEIERRTYLRKADGVTTE